MRARMMLAVVVAVAVITAACGDSKSSLLPTAPSGLAAAPNVDASTTASGTMGNKPKPGNGNGRAPGATTETATKVEFEGAIEDVNADGSIKVDGQWIAIVAGQTVIRKGDRDVPQSELKKGDRVHVTANKTGTALVATEIKLQNPCNSCPVEPPPSPDPQVVTVMALDNEAVEGTTNTATFRLTRTATDAQRAASLSVSVTTLGSTASAGLDYTSIASTQTFRAGELTADVVVTALNDSDRDAGETVVLNLVAGPGYVVGTSSGSATVTINDPPPQVQQVSVRVDDDDVHEFENAGRFEITRTGDTSQPLTVTLQFSGGTALFGTDYIVMSPSTSVSTFTVTFEANQTAMVFVTVMPLYDEPDAESNETITLTVVDGPDYDPGAQSSATVVIVEDFFGN